MADNSTFKDASLATVGIAMRDTGVVDGSGDLIKAEKVDTAPWVETPVTTAQVKAVSSATVVTITPPTGATHAYISVEGGPLRFYNTGDTPTASNGHLLADGTGPIEVSNVALLKFIAVSASGTVQLSFHKYTA